MQFSIRRNEFLRQLPKGELPSEIIFEGTPYNQKNIGNSYKEYADIADVLSRTQWAMFKEMLDNPKGATLTQLLKHCSPGLSLNENLVAVHILNLRKKLKKYKKPYKIISVRSGNLIETTYKLDRIFV